MNASSSPRATKILCSQNISTSVCQPYFFWLDDLMSSESRHTVNASFVARGLKCNECRGSFECLGDERRQASHIYLILAYYNPYVTG